MWERRKFPIVTMLIACCVGGPSFAAESTIAGTGAVTGTVTAAKPFTAAHVYLRGADTPVTFMVYRSGTTRARRSREPSASSIRT